MGPTSRGEEGNGREGKGLRKWARGGVDGEGVDIA